MIPDLFSRRRTRFVLWRPAHVAPVPSLFIGQPRPGAHPYDGFRELPLRYDPEFPELWERPADECGLTDGGVYLYWFRVRDSQPYDPAPRVLYVTDPFATAVDRRFLAPAPRHPIGEASGRPASVVKYRDGRLVPCDPGGEEPDWSLDPATDTLPPNHRLVLYELPTRWVRPTDDGGRTVGKGTFRDVVALIEPDAAPPSFPGLTALGPGRAHLADLGVNALELLPPADSDDDLNWGYGTAHYFAADFDLGGGAAAPTPTRDLADLIQTCHRRGLRFFADMVTAFSRNDPYRRAGFPDFYVHWRPDGDPARDPEQAGRDGFGGDLFRYNHRVDGYDPLGGGRGSLVPARAYMRLAAAHWLDLYRVNGLRLDSVNNTGSWDFLEELKDSARRVWREAERHADLDPGTLAERFLVVGEDLAVPLALLTQHRLDGLWNEGFKHAARRVLLGRSADGDPDFETTVRRLIDCRLRGFADTSQAVNYLTSHDVGGVGNERLYDFLVRNGVADAERRIKLGFTCLLTAVGIPMILAGDEFADQHDLDILDEHAAVKQVDPVNYARLGEPWRRRVFDHVARLVRLRTASPALSSNDTRFLHADFDEGKRVVVWQRGAGAEAVVVVANFSDWGTPDPGSPTAEYRVPGFPAAPAGRRWREVTQDRDVPPDWAGREPVYPWEAKVYLTARSG
jgi:glycosidase